MKLAGLIPHFSRDKVQTRVLTDAPDGVLTSATVGGAFMLFPRKPDWSDIRAIAQHPYQPTIPSSTPSTAPGRKHTPQSARLEIKNGTTRTGFAAQIAAKLEKNHFDIVAFGNAVRRGFEETLIVDFTDGKKSEALERLRKALQAKVTLIVPPWITPATATLTRTLSQDGLPTERMQFANTDFLVILGETSYPLIEPSSPMNLPHLTTRCAGRPHECRQIHPLESVGRRGRALVATTPTPRDRQYGSSYGKVPALI